MLKQVNSIKTDSEKKCGKSVDLMQASPLSGKPPVPSDKKCL